jgi:hypothetical protein
MNVSTTIPGEKCGLIDLRRHAALGILTLAVAIPMLLTGCVLSVEPVILESEAIYDARLIGSWEEIDGSDRATITGDGEEYSIEYTDGEDTRAFAGRLGWLGERMVLDVWPVRTDDTGTPHDAMLLPGHLLVQLEIGIDEITARTLDPDAMTAALDRGDLSLAHTNSLLRGSSEELRSALNTYLTRPEALGEASVWRRVATAQPPATN